ncbi:MAG: transcriptional repressor [Candidatus Azobacteroides sp.]|nr:transcriptional repressor [Candidatus Azobacteroides sp.]
MNLASPLPLNDIRQIFSSNGIKITPQRIAVYQALMRLKHPGVEEVVEEVHKTFLTITVSTVYNVLEFLCEKNIIAKVRTSSGRMRYENHCQPHHHIYDEEKDVLTDYYDEELNALLKDYFDKKQIPGWEISDCQLYISGKYLRK